MRNVCCTISLSMLLSVSLTGCDNFKDDILGINPDKDNIQDSLDPVGPDPIGPDPVEPNPVDPDPVDPPPGKESIPWTDLTPSRVIKKPDGTGPALVESEKPVKGDSKEVFKYDLKKPRKTFSDEEVLREKQWQNFLKFADKNPDDFYRIYPTPEAEAPDIWPELQLIELDLSSSSWVTFKDIPAPDGSSHPLAWSLHPVVGTDGLIDAKVWGSEGVSKFSMTVYGEDKSYTLNLEAGFLFSTRCLVEQLHSAQNCGDGYDGRPLNFRLGDNSHLPEGLGELSGQFILEQRPWGQGAEKLLQFKVVVNAGEIVQVDPVDPDPVDPDPVDQEEILKNQFLSAFGKPDGLDYSIDDLAIDHWLAMGLDPRVTELSGFDSEGLNVVAKSLWLDSEVWSEMMGGWHHQIGYALDILNALPEFDQYLGSINYDIDLWEKATEYFSLPPYETEWLHQPGTYYEAYSGEGQCKDGWCGSLAEWLVDTDRLDPMGGQWTHVEGEKVAIWGPDPVEPDPVVKKPTSGLFTKASDNQDENIAAWEHEQKRQAAPYPQYYGDENFDAWKATWETDPQFDNKPTSELFVDASDDQDANIAAWESGRAAWESARQKRQFWAAVGRGSDGEEFEIKDLTLDHFAEAGLSESVAELPGYDLEGLKQVAQVIAGIDPSVDQEGIESWAFDSGFNVLPGFQNYLYEADYSAGDVDLFAIGVDFLVSADDSACSDGYCESVLEYIYEQQLYPPAGEGLEWVYDATDRNLYLDNAEPEELMLSDLVGVDLVDDCVVDETAADKGCGAISTITPAGLHYYNGGASVVVWINNASGEEDLAAKIDYLWTNTVFQLVRDKSSSDWSQAEPILKEMVDPFRFLIADGAAYVGERTFNCPAILDDARAAFETNFSRSYDRKEEMYEFATAYNAYVKVVEDGLREHCPRVLMDTSLRLGYVAVFDEPDVDYDKAYVFNIRDLFVDGPDKNQLWDDWVASWETDPQFDNKPTSGLFTKASDNQDENIAAWEQWKHEQAVESIVKGTAEPLFFPADTDDSVIETAVEDAFLSVHESAAADDEISFVEVYRGLRDAVKDAFLADGKYFVFIKGWADHLFSSYESLANSGSWESFDLFNESCEEWEDCKERMPWVASRWTHNYVMMNSKDIVQLFENDSAQLFVNGYEYNDEVLKKLFANYAAYYSGNLESSALEALGVPVIRFEGDAIDIDLDLTLAGDFGLVAVELVKHPQDAITAFAEVPGWNSGDRVVASKSGRQFNEDWSKSLTKDQAESLTAIDGYYRLGLSVRLDFGKEDYFWFSVPVEVKEYVEPAEQLPLDEEFRSFVFGDSPDPAAVTNEHWLFMGVKQIALDEPLDASWMPSLPEVAGLFEPFAQKCSADRGLSIEECRVSAEEFLIFHINQAKDNHDSQVRAGNNPMMMMMGAMNELSHFDMEMSSFFVDGEGPGSWECVAPGHPETVVMGTERVEKSCKTGEIID